MHAMLPRNVVAVIKASKRPLAHTENLVVGQ